MNSTMTIKDSILVTGGAGYIGAHACKALKRAGYTPIAYDNLVYGHRSAVKWGPLEEGDIAKRQRLESVIGQYKPMAVMHFAAYAYVGESVTNPSKYYRNNVAGTLTLLETMRSCGIDKIIFSSTCATYGMPEQIPITEDHPQNPINPYVKATYRYYKPVTDDFMLRFQQVVYWEYEDGLGTTTRADAEWLLNEGQILRWGNYFKIHDNTDGLAWNTNLSLYQRVGRGRAVALRGLVRGETGKDVHPTKYQLVAIYRQRFLRDWLFVELYGGASWIRRELEDPREFVPELGLVFEIVFGDHPMLGD